MDDLSPQALDVIDEVAGWLEQTALATLRNKGVRDGVLVAARLLRNRTSVLRPGDTREIYLVALPQVLPWATEVYTNSVRTEARGEVVTWNAKLVDNQRRQRAELNHETVVEAMRKLAGDRRYKQEGSPLDIADVECLVDVVDASTRAEVNSALDKMTRNAAEAVVQVAIYGEYNGPRPALPLAR